jgi:hypothetical protein
MELIGNSVKVLVCLNMENHGAVENDKKRKPLTKMLRPDIDGYQISLALHDGLPIIKCLPSADVVVISIFYIFMTSDVEFRRRYYIILTD